MHRDEILIALYLAVTRFAEVKIFQTLLTRNNSFMNLKPEWNLLFTEQNIFRKLQFQQSSIERLTFNLIALQVSIQNEYSFMVEEILDGRAGVTPTMIELLLNEKQYKSLISLISIPKHRIEQAYRPKFIDLKNKMYGDAIK